MALAGYGFAQDRQSTRLWARATGIQTSQGHMTQGPMPQLGEDSDLFGGAVGDLIDSILICGSLELCFMGLDGLSFVRGI